jgi:hypothetical protein
MIPYNQLYNAIDSGDFGTLENKFGPAEVKNSVIEYDRLGADKYRTQYGQPDLPASTRGSIVPYDEKAGLFSFKNFKALTDNLAPDAQQTYEGLKAVIDEPELLAQMFTREGLAAIIDDYADLVESPSRRIVEQPFTTLLDLAPFSKGTGTIVKKALPRPVTNTLSNLDQYLGKNAPLISRIVKESGEAVTDPAKTTARAGVGVVKGLGKINEKAFRSVAEILTGLDRETIQTVLDSPKLSPKQKAFNLSKPAYTPSGAAMRLAPGRLGIPSADVTPLRYFKEVITEVRDESVMLQDILKGLSEVNQEITDVFQKSLPDVFDQMTERFDLMPAVEKFKDQLTQPLTAVKVSLQQQEVQKVIKNQTSHGYIAAEATQMMPVMVPRITIDLSGSSLAGLSDNRLQLAVDFLNNHFKNANSMSPKDAFILMNNIDNLIKDIPLRGADKITPFLATLRGGIRDELDRMTEKVPGGKTISEQLKEVDENLSYLNSVSREFSLYVKSKSGEFKPDEVPPNVNAGTVLKKIMGAGKHTNKYRKRLLERLEARVGPITTGLAALQTKELLPSNLVGRNLAISALGTAGGALAGGAGLATFSLMGTFALSSPKIMSRWARWLGYPKRVGDYVEELGKVINENKTARMMSDAGYTVGGILLNHGKIRQEAEKRASEDERIKRNR